MSDSKYKEYEDFLKSIDDILLKIDLHAANCGNIHAIYIMSHRYELGLGVEENDQKSEYWRGKRKSQSPEIKWNEVDIHDELNHITNKLNIGTLESNLNENIFNHAFNQNVRIPGRTLSIFRYDKLSYLKATYIQQTFSSSVVNIVDNHNNVEHLLELGVMYLLGRSVKTDFEKSKKFLKLSSNKGCQRAKDVLIFAFKDYAFKHYIRLAENNNSEAQFKLGEIYCGGDGVLKDYKKCKTWIEKSYENGCHINPEEIWNKYELWKY